MCIGLVVLALWSILTLVTCRLPIYAVRLVGLCAVPLCVRPAHNKYITIKILSLVALAGSPTHAQRPAATAALLCCALCHQWWDQRRLFHYSALCRSLCLLSQSSRLLQIAFPDLLMQESQWQSHQTNWYFYFNVHWLNIFNSCEIAGLPSSISQNFVRFWQDVWFETWNIQMNLKFLFYPLLTYIYQHDFWLFALLSKLFLVNGKRTEVKPKWDVSAYNIFPVTPFSHHKILIIFHFNSLKLK